MWFMKRKGMNFMKEIILKVEGMVCNGCENRVQNALQNIDGVKSVIADHTTNTVTVITENAISEESLKEKIQDIGYEIKE